MTDEIDAEVLAAYRAAGREEPGEATDARVLGAALLAPVASPPWLWAEAAAVMVLIGAALILALRTPTGPPSHDDPRYFGLYAGRETSLLLALGETPPDPIAAGLLQAGRRPLKE